MLFPLKYDWTRRDSYWISICYSDAFESLFIKYFLDAKNFVQNCLKTWELFLRLNCRFIFPKWGYLRCILTSIIDFNLKNLVWHSHIFLLPYIIVEEYFINSITFIFNLYFICFVVDDVPAFIIIVYDFWTYFSVFCLSTAAFI